MLDPKDCFACRFPNPYDIDSIKWLLSEKKLCADHVKKAEDQIANPVEKKLKVTVKQKDRNFSERQPGEEG